MSGHKSAQGRDAHERRGLLFNQDGQISYGASDRNGNNDTSPGSPASGSGHVEVMPPMSKLGPILGALWLCVLISSLDGTIVATLLSSISSSFSASEQSAWLGSSYLLSVCCFTPIYGRLADIIGRKYSMTVALVLFTVGTLLCGISNSMVILIAARALAGMGGGGLTTLSSVILTDLVPLRNRGLYQGATNVIFGIGGSLGGPIGGVLNDTRGWRFAFLIQIPFLVVALVLVLWLVNIELPKPAEPQSKRQKLASVDFLGSITIALAVSSVLISLSLMSANDFSIKNPFVWGGFVVSAISWAAFFFVESKVARQPVLPLRLLDNRTGCSVAFTNLFLSIASFAILYNFPLWFEAVKLQTASEAGLHLIPNSAAISVGSVLAGIWMRQTGRYYRFTLFSGALVVLSSALLITFDLRTPSWLMYAAIAPGGFGLASVLTTTLIALINAVPRSDIAVATGMSYLFRSTGQILGVSMSGVMLQSLLKKELRHRITGPGSEELISRIRKQSTIVKELPPAIQAEAVEAYLIALRWVFISITIMSVAMVAASAWMRDDPLPEFQKAKRPDAEQEEGATSSSSRDD